MPLTGHAATTVLPVGADTHTVENSEGELVAVGKKPVVLDGERDALRDGVAVGVTR